MDTHRDAVMYCRRCGVLAPRVARFCGGCRSDLSGESSRILVRLGPVVRRRNAFPPRAIGSFGDLVLVRMAGRGGMGVVYEAFHRLSGQTFGLKLVSDHFRLRSGTEGRFKEEAAAQSSIVHLDVVRMFGLERHGGKLGLVMEYVAGSTLASLIHSGARGMDLRAIGWCLGHMAAGLAEVHRRAYVHADIKPTNFLYGKDAMGSTVLKITDFGVTRNLRDQLTGGGHARVTSGTPGYMSPEQIRGDPLSPASDFYSVGCVLYEMLTGQPVFPFGDPRLKQRHLTEEPARVSTIRPGLPEGIDRSVMALLVKDSSMRPSSLDAVKRALQYLA